MVNRHAHADDAVNMCAGVDLMKRQFYTFSSIANNLITKNK